MLGFVDSVPACSHSALARCCGYRFPCRDGITALLQFSHQLLLESQSYLASFCVSLRHCSFRHYYMYIHSTRVRRLVIEWNTN
jgi:hypothetical protein